MPVPVAPVVMAPPPMPVMSTQPMPPLPQLGAFVQPEMAPPLPPLPALPPAAPTKSSRRGLLLRLLPIGIVVIGLATAIGRDLMFREPAEEPMPEIDYANPLLDLKFHQVPERGDYVPTPSMRFGLTTPDPENPKKVLKLIYDEFGRTCNVCVQVDSNIEYMWGTENGSWRAPMKQDLGKDLEGHRLIGAKSVWERNAAPRIVITQYVEIVPGGLSADGKKRLLDTCLIRHDITNDDGMAHKVGLRFLLDTFIGRNDAVPFTIAGAKELCDTMMQFNRPEDVPDYISALERQDLKNPGTVAHLSLKYGGGLEPPTRVTLGAWPAPSLRRVEGGTNADGPNTRWNVPVLSMALAKSAETDGDSAVTLYWDAKEIPPKQTRMVGFAYGLGNVTGDKGEGQLGITSGGELVAGKDFTLTAYVKNPAPGTTITLALPKTIELTAGKETESVPPIPPGASSPYSLVTWKVKAVKGGVFPLKVSLSTGAKLQYKLVVRQAAEIFK
jgi:hypothetical protein